MCISNLEQLCLNHYLYTDTCPQPLCEEHAVCTSFEPTADLENNEVIDHCEHIPEEYCNADYPMYSEWKVCQWNAGNTYYDLEGNCREVQAAAYDELCLVAQRQVTTAADVMQPREIIE